jgi:hypothetical protein
MEHEAVAIWGENQRDLERRGVVEGLLHPVANAMIVVLRFDQCDRNVRSLFHQKPIVRGKLVTRGKAKKADFALNFSSHPAPG